MFQLIFDHLNESALQVSEAIQTHCATFNVDSTLEIPTPHEAFNTTVQTM